MVTRYYSSVAAETTLTGGINNSATVIAVASTTGFPALTPYTLALDYESATEELVEVTGVGGLSLTVTRGIDGTSATSHNAGARVRHVSSARDFADSREHENDDTGVHGVTGDLVGTTDTQTLTNKTLTDATGTLNRVDILSEGGTAWTTTVNGDIDFTSANLMQWRRGPSEAHEVVAVNNNGNVSIRNQNAAADSLTGTYRIRVVRDDGTTDIFSVLQGGNVVAWTDAGVTGFQVKPRTATDAAAFNVRNVGDTVSRFTVFNDGRMLINNGTAASIPITVIGAVGQTANLTEWRDDGGSMLALVDELGHATFPYNSETTGVTPAAGWTVTTQTYRELSGVRYVSISLTRSGADIVVPASGNVSPDIQMATVPANWTPTESLYTHASTGLNNGTARINTDSTVDLTDWTSSQTIQTGAILRFSGTFIKT